MPEHHDPIDELARFGAGLGSATPGGDMPLSAADVRRRGDQIRRRRTALVVGGAALAVAAVAVPVFAIVGNGDPRGDQDRFTDSPVLATGDLLRDADTQYEPGRLGAFRTTDTSEGDGQAVSFRCQREKLGALGAETSFTRTYDYVPDPSAGDVPESDLTTDDLVETVAQFPTAEAARAAYETLTAWTAACEIPGADRVTVDEPARSVDVPGAEAVVYDARWTPSPDPTAGYLGELGLLLQDDRIAVLQSVVVGQDSTFVGSTPVERMLPTAAARLRPGPGPDDAPSTPRETVTADPGADAVDPAIPADLPLAQGWPTQPGDGTGIEGPSPDLEPLSFQACDATLPDAPHAERLLARYDDAEDYRARQLTTYATADEAVAAVAAIRELYAACPVGKVRDDGMTPHWAVRDTAVGGESFAVLGWDELDGAATTFGDTLLVVRLGSAVLVVAHAGHSGNPQGREQQAIDDIVAESAPVVARMCAWTVAGC